MAQDDPGKREGAVAGAGWSGQEDERADVAGKKEA